MTQYTFNAWTLADFGLNYDDAAAPAPTVSFNGISSFGMVVEDDDTNFDDPFNNTPGSTPGDEPGTPQIAVGGPVPGGNVDVLFYEEVLDSNGNVAGYIHYFGIDTDDTGTTGSAHNSAEANYFALTFSPDPNETYTLGGTRTDADGTIPYADLDGASSAPECLIYDMIQTTGTANAGAGETFSTIDGELTGVSEAGNFSTSTFGPTNFTSGDTAVVDGVTYTVTNHVGFNGTVTYNGGLTASVSGDQIELTDANGDKIFYTLLQDGADYPNITEISYDVVVNSLSVGKGQYDDDNDVSLMSGCVYYDFIQLSSTPTVNGTSMTQAAGELIEVDEPMVFTQADPNVLNTGDTTVIDGVTWEITNTDPVKTQFTDDDGTHSVFGYLIEMSDGAGGTLSYMVPIDTEQTSSTILEDHTNITQIDFLSIGSSTTGIQKENIDDNNEVTLICFAGGTEIVTSTGRRAIETLNVDVAVLTQDHGFQRIQWIGKTTVQATGKFAPIMIKAGALGNDRDLRVSPQHRMLISDWRAEVMFDANEVLIAATHLVNGDTIFAQPGGTVDYYHILFENHEIIFAEGIPSESFHPGELGMNGLADAQRDEVYTLFPELMSDFTAYGPSARSTLKASEVQVLQIAAE